MIIIINGSVGVGKTSVSWELQEKFDKSIMLDGDYIGAVHPFEIYDDNRIQYLYDTLLLLVKFHHTNGYNDFVLNYVFESDKQLMSLVERLKAVIPEIYCFWLTCSNEEQKNRISRRRTSQIDWELERFIELNDIQKKASRNGYIREKLLTDHKNIHEIVDIIWNKIHSNAAT